MKFQIFFHAYQRDGREKKSILSMHKIYQLFKK